MEFILAGKLVCLFIWFSIGVFLIIHYIKEFRKEFRNGFQEIFGIRFYNGKRITRYIHKISYWELINKE